MDELTQMSADPETRAEYDARVREMNRIYAGQTVKYKEGLEKGREEGKAEGLEEGEKIGGDKKAVEIARKMLLKGLDMQNISELTGLSPAEIEALK